MLVGDDRVEIEADAATDREVDVLCIGLEDLNRRLGDGF